MWESTAAANVWDPGVYGWKAVTMTATQTTLIWLNLVGAFAAMLTNARAAATPHLRDRFEFGMAATLATLFAVAMVVQLVTDTRLDRPVPPTVGGWWRGCSWCWPAVVTVRKQRR